MRPHHVTQKAAEAIDTIGRGFGRQPHARARGQESLGRERRRPPVALDAEEDLRGVDLSRTATSKTLRATAIHEAGHAVARIVLRRKINRVSIIPGDDGSLGHVQGRVLPAGIAEVLEFGTPTPQEMAAVEDSIVSVLAAPIAERKFTGRWNLVGASGDHEWAVGLVFRLSGSTEEVNASLKELEGRANDLVETYWADIEAVAAALLERKVLSGAAVRRVIRESRESDGGAEELTKEEE